MFKYIRIFTLVLIVLGSIYFNEILRYISINYVKDITYKNHKVKLPSNLFVESSTFDNKLYLYDILRKYDDVKQKNKNEKVYILSLNKKQSIALFINKINKQFNKSDINIVNKNIDFFNIKEKNKVFKYKNLIIHYLNIQNKYFIKVNKNNIEYTIFINKITDDDSLNKIILQLVNNINISK